MRADLRAEPAIEGSIARARTPEGLIAEQAFLDSVQAVLDWGRSGWERARVAKIWCEKQGR